MMRFSVKASKEEPGKLLLMSDEGTKEWKIVESNYKMIVDWLKSNLEFAEARVEQNKARMDLVAINQARVEYCQKLVEEARVSASGKSEYYFKVLDDSFANYMTK